MSALDSSLELPTTSRLIFKARAAMVGILIIVAAIIVAAMVFLAQPKVEAASETQIAQVGQTIVNRLTAQLKQVDGLTGSAARTAAALPKNAPLFIAVLERVFDNGGDKTLFGGGIWPEPNAFERGVEKYSFYWTRDKSGQLNFDESYNQADTAYHQEPWYTSAKNNDGSRCTWSAGYLDLVSRELMVTCSVAWREGGRANGALQGVATSDISLSEFERVIQEVGGSTGGYSFAVDQDNQMLYFPGVDVKSKIITKDQLAQQMPSFAPIADKITQAQNSHSTVQVEIKHDPKIGAAARAHLFEMPETGWIIGVVTPEKRLTAMAWEITTSVLVVLIPAVSVVLWLASLSIGRLLRRLDKIRQAFTVLASGDLRERVQVQGRDEITQISVAFNNFVARISHALQDIRQSAHSVELAATEIASGNQDLSNRTEAQAGSLEETSSAMEQLTATVQQNADNAAQANHVGKEAADVATKANIAVQQVVATMGAISQSSGKIKDIIGVIDGIAFQTNILALNAAVEAARAGEQGRGFAVVAAEVRSLAQRSATAAKEIKELIDESVKQAEMGGHLVDEAGLVMNQVVERIGGVATLVNEITNASREQSMGIAEVGAAVTQMDQATQQNAALVEQAAAAAQSLRQQAEHLNELVATFKMDDAQQSRHLTLR